MQISRIFHAGYQFESGGTQILFDPLFENPFSQNCFAFPNVEFDHQQIKKIAFSAVFISHYHDDHCSFESLNVLDRNIPIYFFCIFEELFALLKKLGFKKVFPLKLNQSVFVGPFEIIPRKALDEDVDCVFHIKVEQLNILNVVDSWIDDETFENFFLTNPWDLVLWPFQLLQELEVLSPERIKSEKSVSLPKEWTDQIKRLNPKMIIPSSCHFKFEDWSWYNDVYFPISYKKFADEVESVGPHIQVIRLNPSESISLNSFGVKKVNPLSWVIPIGDQDVDYSYKPEVKPSTTSEIAQKFKPLSAFQKQRVFNYCQSEILEIYQALETPGEVYFDKARIWKLSLFDHEGTQFTFFYEVQKSKIAAIKSDQAKVAWSTEIPIQKLYSALENGESLSSLYMRINDLFFAEEIEKEIIYADILCDPLLRCLFSGQIGSYQKAQLARLGYR